MTNDAALKTAQRRYDAECPFDLAEDILRCERCEVGEVILRRNKTEICENCGHAKDTEQEPELLLQQPLIEVRNHH